MVYARLVEELEGDRGRSTSHTAPMTTADAQLSLRPPAWARGWLVAFPVLFVLFAVFVVRPREGGSVAMTVFLCVFAVALSWRLSSLHVTGTPDGRLVVRNHWRSRMLHRDEITGVGVARVPGRTGNRAVALDLRDGSTLRLDVTQAPGLPFLRSRLDEQAAAIEGWRSGLT
jgi:hypothetical protein